MLKKITLMELYMITAGACSGVSTAAAALPPMAVAKGMPITALLERIQVCAITPMRSCLSVQIWPIIRPSTLSSESAITTKIVIVTGIS